MPQAHFAAGVRAAEPFLVTTDGPGLDARGFVMRRDMEIVAYSHYREDGPNEITCIRASCQGWIGNPTKSPIPLTSEDLPDGGLCSVCGTDVLA